MKRLIFIVIILSCEFALKAQLFQNKEFYPGKKLESVTVFTAIIKKKRIILSQAMGYGLILFVLLKN